MEGHFSSPYQHPRTLLVAWLMVREHGVAVPWESKPGSLVLTPPESPQGTADIPLQGINESAHLTFLCFESEKGLNC